MEIAQTVLRSAEIVYGPRSAEVKALIHIIGTTDLSTASGFKKIREVLRSRKLLSRTEIDHLLSHEASRRISYESPAYPGNTSHAAALLVRNATIEVGQVIIWGALGKGSFSPDRVFKVEASFPRASIQLSNTDSRMSVKNVVPCRNCEGHWNFTFKPQLSAA